MVTVYDENANDLIDNAAKELEKVETMKMPAWATFVKTGAGKERPPAIKNWWYVRAASILRKIYTRKGPIGVSKLRKLYTAKKNMGHKPERVYPASGKVTRVVLQQLEKSGFIKLAEKGVRKGRELTPKGRSFLDKIVVKK